MRSGNESSSAHPDTGLGLAALLSELRSEIEAAQRQLLSEKKEPMFVIRDVEAQVHFTVDRSTTGGGGLKFHLFAVEGKHEYRRENVHCLTLKLEPAGNAELPFAERE
jgi:hypothetical protein